MNSVDQEIKIRPFQPADQETVRQLILEGLGEHFDQIDESLNPDLENIFKTYSGSGHSFAIAVFESQIVGTGALLTESRETGRVARVSVLPDYRGQGIGRAIIEHLLEIGRQKGFRQILVETNYDWSDAIKLYQNCGFQQIDRDEISVYMRLLLDT